MEWSGKGDAILLGGMAILHLDTGTMCRIPEGINRVTFTGLESLIALRMGSPRSLASGTTTFVSLNSSCSITADQEWTVPEDWLVDDTSLTQGTLAVSRLGPDLRYSDIREVLAVDPQSRKVVQRWSGNGYGGEVKFAEEGKAICRSGRMAGKSPKIPVKCFDVESGEQIAELATVNGGSPIATASRAATVVATDLHYRPYIIMDGGDYVERRRVVWDFRTNKEVASWKPGSQRYALKIGKEAPHLKEEYFPFSVSPNGQFIAEGGDGMLRLYEIVR